MVYANQYMQVLKLQSLRIFRSIVVFTVVQIIISLGIAIGFTYLYADADRQSILYLATGAPTIVLIMTGLIILPNQISNARIEGHGEFLRTLPVNRSAIIMADTTIWLLVTIPGTIVSSIATNFIFYPSFAYRRDEQIARMASNCAYNPPDRLNGKDHALSFGISNIYIRAMGCCKGCNLVYIGVYDIDKNPE